MKLILFTFSFISAISAFSQDMTFYRENITMRIEREKFYVTGLYYLRCERPEKKLLVYPFPAGQRYGPPDSVLIIDLTTGKEVLPLKADSTKLLFDVDFSTDPGKLVQISYQQELLGNHAEYILRSTRAWHQPLEEAHYQLITPQFLQITRFSIPPQDTLLAGKETIYTWELMNYMPETNMIIEFEADYEK